MYVPGWPGLAPGDFFPSSRPKAPPFPLSAPHRTFAYVARNVIYHLFRCLRLAPGETVLVPEYHSGVEVWAMRAAGASVRFYPIDRQLQPDLDALERLCTANTRVLYVIHFIGWPQPLEPLRALCRARGLLMIEDCALALLSQKDGHALGTSGDYAVYCLYKTLPVPNGGLLVQNRNVLEDLTRLKLQPCTVASVAGRSAELFFEWLRGRSDSLGRALGGVKRGVGRALNAIGVRRLPVGDISPGFSTSGFDVAKMDIGMSALCHGLLTRFDYDSVRRRRRENFALLGERLAGKTSLLDKTLEEGMCPLFFPLLVPDKGKAVQALRARGIGAVPFWNYGHPAAERHASADTRFLRAHVLELPIHQGVTPAQVEYMADQVLDLRLSL